MNILEKKIFSTESQNAPENLVNRIIFAYNELRIKLQVDKNEVSFAGVECQGPLDIKNGTIVHIATMGFRDVPIKEMLSKLGIKTNVTLIFSATQALLAARAGADIATIPYKVILQMIKHPLTDSGIEKFNADWAGANR